MVPLCSPDPFVSVRVQGFWFPLLTPPSGHFPLILRFPTHHSIHYSHLSALIPQMSSSFSNSIPAGCIANPVSPVFTEAILANGYDHIRDSTPNEYMVHGTWFSELGPTYMQVWGWDQTMLFVTNALSLEWSPFVFRSLCG